MKKALLLTLTLCSLGMTALPASAQTTTPATPATPANPQTLYPSGATLAQLQTIQGFLGDLKTLQGSSLDLERGRVVVVGLSAVDRLTLHTRLRAAGLLTSFVDYQTGQPGVTRPPAGPATPVTPATPAPVTPLPSVTTLPVDGAPLAVAHTATLSGPQVIQAGQDTLWSFNLSNRGAAPLRLEHGACDVRFEVLSPAGEIVRPDPRNAICTLQLVITDLQPGEIAAVQNIRWNGKNAQGQNVPAGQYTLRAVFKSAGVISDRATLTVTVR